MSVFMEARRNSPLAEYVAKWAGNRGRRIGQSLRFAACPACGEGTPGNPPLSVTGDFFTCHRCGRHGDVSAFAAAVTGLPPAQAARELAKGGGAPPAKADCPPGAGTTKAQAESLAKVVEAIRAAPVPPQPKVMAYLARRGIGRATIEGARERGLVRFLPEEPGEAFSLLREICGEDLLRASGVWRQEARIPGIAYRPLVSVAGTSAEFRLARAPRKGEPKGIRYGPASPWLWKGEKGGSAVVEGVIDLLSMVEMGFRGTVLALPGAASWRDEWFYPLAGQTVNICLDGDEPGRAAGAKLLHALAQRGLFGVLKEMPDGKDVNDILVDRKST